MRGFVLSLLLSDYDYHLPESLIADRPATTRSESRLLVLRKNADWPVDDFFHNLQECLQPDDVLVLNDTRVLPARLLGKKVQTGGKVEVLLSRPVTENVWVALVKASKKQKQGPPIILGAEGQPPLEATVLEPVEEEPGAFHVEFSWRRATVCGGSRRDSAAALHAT